MKIKDLKQALIGSFSWHLSPQGYKYWNNVYEELSKLKDENEE